MKLSKARPKDRPPVSPMVRRCAWLCVAVAIAGFLPLHAGVAQPADESVTIETAHYTLHYQGAPADAEEAARVLEIAYPQLKAFFGTEPRLARGEKLVIHFLASKGAWAAAMQADGLGVPRGAGGFYSPQTRRVYLYRQPTVYFTRQLLIHEATHQFHYLSRTNNQHLGVAWYVEGLAEYIAHHTWDGETLKLGVLPAVTLKDSAAKALASFESGALSLADLVAGRGPQGYPEQWVFVRFLLTAENGKYRRKFERLAARLDAGQDAAELFARLVERPERLQDAFIEWLRAEQEPFQQVFTTWVDIGEGRIRASADVVSICAGKRPAREITARFDIPTGDDRWRVGLLVDFTSNADWTVALVTQDWRLQVHRYVEGGWKIIHDGELPAAARPAPDADAVAQVTMGASREESAVEIRVNGAAVGRFAVGTGGRMGLAIDHTATIFREVSLIPCDVDGR